VAELLGDGQRNGSIREVFSPGAKIESILHCPIVESLIRITVGRLSFTSATPISGCAGFEMKVAIRCYCSLGKDWSAIMHETLVAQRLMFVFATNSRR
jgi:hypothetical protein